MKATSEAWFGKMEANSEWSETKTDVSGRGGRPYGSTMEGHHA
jgi:hypothetical protein